MQKTALFTVVYPAAAPFLKDFAESVFAQTDLGFDLVVVNDGLSDAESFFSAAPALGPRCRLIDAPSKATAAAARRFGLRQCRALEYDWIICLDADDCAGPKRVAALRPWMTADNRDVLFHDVRLFGTGCPDEGVSAWSNRFVDGDALTLQDIRDGHPLGLTNTAFPVSRLAGVLERIPDHLVAFDWALFSLILAQGGAARWVADPDAVTRYRQHGSNLAGLLDRSEQALRWGRAVKRAHYEFMATMATQDPSFAASAGQAAAKRPLKRPPQCATTPGACALWWEDVLIGAEEDQK